MEVQIKAEFKKSGFDLEDEEEILKKCLAFCINYHLKPSDIVSSWEVYYLNRQLNDSTVQTAEMDGFLLHLQNEQKEVVIKEEPNLHAYSIKDVDMILNNDEADAEDNMPGTPIDRSQHIDMNPFDSTSPANGYVSSLGKPSKLVTPFGSRTERFAVRFSINNMPAKENGKIKNDHENHEDDVIRKVYPRKKCSLTVHGSGPQPGCRYMYDRIEDRLTALENRIEKHAKALVASGLYEEPIDPTVASQRTVFTVGMICCDGEGRLNEKSILLQSSIEQSGGQHVRLELQQLSQFSIFPGQVVGIEGHNPSGHCLVASKMVDSLPFSASADEGSHPAKKQAIDKDLHSADMSSTLKELSMIVAAGPFTTTDNLLFEPLSELLAYAKRKSPQLLILMGPFVDYEHPEIKKGSVDRTFDGVFHLEVLRKLQDYLEHMGPDARVILVPSIRDANHDFVFPQPAFEINLPDLKDQICGLTNPGIFEANQVLIGCCTVDVIKQLSGEEFARIPTDGKPSDRMSRLASHIIRQQSFYPLYPPAEGTPLDFSLAPEALQIPSIPDILILPSDIKYFVKVLEKDQEGEGSKCICVNPGRLAKGEGGGTFVELDYYLGPDTINASIISI